MKKYIRHIYGVTRNTELTWLLGFEDTAKHCMEEEGYTVVDSASAFIGHTDFSESLPSEAIYEAITRNAHIAVVIINATREDDEE